MYLESHQATWTSSYSVKRLVTITNIYNNKSYHLLNIRGLSDGLNITNNDNNKSYHSLNIVVTALLDNLI